jgi:putative oxidoreductase
MTIFAVFAARALLVLLFFPFSALDKLLNSKQAVAQAAEATPVHKLAVLLVTAGLCLEVTLSIAVLTGYADRLAAAGLAAYCITTAVLWKRFWAVPDFALRGPSRGRDVFWDFLKNLAVAGGFLILAFGTDAASARRFMDHPLSSSHPYSP